ncbi:heme ABC transporter ATP-binding protein [Undibacter mobilis]|uniref:Heme ABC transporter ATP-binding protein n=1 Tax=Undibacter mobilis TaxID=2292256 RepID=A0A371B7S2_9BRAD|nr:heme ABC transporter ATP-binding protein [Undibacter mobilis]RDV03572.1 heme ABC transporter ATP-binding protein [Undibacter mobilis]
MNVVDVQALSVRVGAKRLLDDVSFSVRQGETVAVIGPNGAGKSTLLRTVSGEIAPSTGTILLKGRAPQAWQPRDLALQRAVLSQNITVTFPFTVIEVVRMGAGDRRGKAIDAMAEAALAAVDLAGFHDRIIGTLSGGEQQRVHFARVMVQLACGEEAHGPGLLLLDEPTASLDLRHQLDLVAVARQCAARGTTTIAIVHDLNLAALMAERVIVLSQGRLAADGTPSDTINDETLSRVFGVSSVVGRAPAAGVPFVLPHQAERLRA